MTEPLDPEIKALRAIVRAVTKLDFDAQVRAVDWLHERIHRTAEHRVSA